VNDDDNTPVMYDHCVAVYNRMADEAVIKESEAGVRIAVWEGFLTRLIQNDLNLAVPYYSSVRANLVRMGCMRQLRRGGGSAKSQWEVIKPPTRTLFENAEATGNARLRQKDTQKQQVNDLSQRVGKLEAANATLIGFVNELQKQLTEHLNTEAGEVA